MASVTNYEKAFSLSSHYQHWWSGPRLIKTVFKSAVWISFINLVFWVRSAGTMSRSCSLRNSEWNRLIIFAAQLTTQYHRLQLCYYVQVYCLVRTLFDSTSQITGNRAEVKIRTSWVTSGWVHKEFCPRTILTICTKESFILHEQSNSMKLL